MKKKLTEMEKKRLETEGKIKVDMVEQALVETAPTKPTVYNKINLDTLRLIQLEYRYD